MNDDYPSSNGSESRSWLERLGQALAGGEPRNREDLLAILQESLERDILDTETFEMLEGAMEVSEMHVRDAMIPRGQMVCVPGNASWDDILPIIVDSGHSRFPVIKDDKDEVTGILLAKDLLKFFGKNECFQLDEIQRPAVFIPESKRLNILLKEFRSSRNHMAIVVDEYGGVGGLITIEDVLEEIVGEIDDEYDPLEAEDIRKHDDGKFTVNALTPIDEFNKYFGTDYSEEEFDTIGGLVTGELGRLPETGETVDVGPMEFQVLKADSRRLLMLGLCPSDV